MLNRKKKTVGKYPCKCYLYQHYHYLLRMCPYSVILISEEILPGDSTGCHSTNETDTKIHTITRSEDKITF